jgi:hypothetical protein
MDKSQFGAYLEEEGDKENVDEGLLQRFEQLKLIQK